mgnify:CR=1 FL=1
MNFYPHHIGDFDKATRHLTRVERSVYRDAIEIYYDTETALTSDLSKLGKRLICRSDEEKAALKSVLDEFFELTEEGYFHTRCDSELSKYRENTSAKSKAGKASAEARRKKAEEREKKRRGVNKQESTGVEQVLDTVATEAQQNPTNQEPRTINQEPIKKKGGKPPTTKNKRFEPPSVQDVIDYKNERNSSVDPNRFVDYYMSTGWMINKNKMKDWKATFRGWESRESNHVNKSTYQPSSAVGRVDAAIQRKSDEREKTLSHQRPSDDNGGTLVQGDDGVFRV